MFGQKQRFSIMVDTLHDHHGIFEMVILIFLNIFFFLYIYINVLLCLCHMTDLHVTTFWGNAFLYDPIYKS
jgi:hypothetical protein